MVACLIVSTQEEATNVSAQKVSKSTKTRFLVKVCGIPILSTLRGDFRRMCGLIFINSGMQSLFIKSDHHQFAYEILHKVCMKIIVYKYLSQITTSVVKTRTIFNSRHR